MKVYSKRHPACQTMDVESWGEDDVGEVCDPSDECAETEACSDGVDYEELSKKFGITIVQVTEQPRRLNAEWTFEVRDDFIEFDSSLAAELDALIYDIEHRDELEASYKKGIE